MTRRGAKDLESCSIGRLHHALGRSVRALGATVVEILSEGVGPGFVAPRWKPGLAGGIEQVPTAGAKETARRPVREEAPFAGTSSGANVVAAIRVAERPGTGATEATLVCDSGLA